MKALVVSIWVFVNLVFFGMCGYMYLLWSQYWMYIEREVEASTSSYDQQIYYYNRGYPLNDSTKFHNFTEARNRIKHSTKESNNVTIIKNSKPRFPNVQADDFLMDTQKYNCLKNDSTKICDNKVTQYKEKLIKEMKRVFLDEGNVLRSGYENYYNVNYKGVRGNYMEKEPKDILCELKKVDIKTVRRADVSNGVYGLKGYLHRRMLFENNRFNSCAVVSSAGSLKGSSLGNFIDSHELVLRFNNAPTKGFESDVGRRTTIRIVNSQVMSKREFRFLDNDIFRNVTILAWDPSNYTASLNDWFQHPEYNLFPNFIEYRKRFPKSRVFLMNPQSIWKLWDFLQSNAPNRLRRNPPSSGFLGVAALLARCDFVDVLEYIPSVRVTKKCHYYDPEDNPSCTFGVWHPLAAEKLLSYYLNVADDKTVFQVGFIRIMGLSKLKC